MENATSNIASTGMVILHIEVILHQYETVFDLSRSLMLMSAKSNRVEAFYTIHREETINDRMQWLEDILSNYVHSVASSVGLPHAAFTYVIPSLMVL